MICATVDVTERIKISNDNSLKLIFFNIKKHPCKNGEFVKCFYSCMCKSNHHNVIYLHVAMGMHGRTSSHSATSTHDSSGGHVLNRQEWISLSKASVHSKYLLDNRWLLWINRHERTRNCYTFVLPNQGTRWLILKTRLGFMQDGMHFSISTKSTSTWIYLGVIITLHQNIHLLLCMTNLKIRLNFEGKITFFLRHWWIRSGDSLLWPVLPSFTFTQVTHISSFKWHFPGPHFPWSAKSYVIVFP